MSGAFYRWQVSQGLSIVAHFGGNLDASFPQALAERGKTAKRELVMATADSQLSPEERRQYANYAKQHLVQLVVALDGPATRAMATAVSWFVPFMKVHNFYNIDEALKDFDVAPEQRLWAAGVLKGWVVERFGAEQVARVRWPAPTG